MKSPTSNDGAANATSILSIMGNNLPVTSMNKQCETGVRGRPHLPSLVPEDIYKAFVHDAIRKSGIFLTGQGS